MVRGNPRDYLPETTKSVLVVSPWNVPRAEAFFRGYGLKIVMVSRYLGVFVGSKAAKDLCMGDNLEGWQDSVATLAGVLHWHPQAT